MKKTINSKLFSLFIIVSLSFLVLIGIYFTRNIYTSYKINRDTPITSTVTDKNGNIIDPLED
ncbi:hypothetical protein [Carnobacterium maltaromaticum]|uniref:hypothetical protein n=1 Tax=Carnobacterium maltaromaticum TaxID=2751 RepID=UPI0039B05A2B